MFLVKRKILLTTNIFCLGILLSACTKNEINLKNKYTGYKMEIIKSDSQKSLSLPEKYFTAKGELSVIFNPIEPSRVSVPMVYI